MKIRSLAVGVTGVAVSVGLIFPAAGAASAAESNGGGRNYQHCSEANNKTDGNSINGMNEQSNERPLKYMWDEVSIVCMWVANNSTVFGGPNQLYPSTYDYYYDNLATTNEELDPQGNSGCLPHWYSGLNSMNPYGEGKPTSYWLPLDPQINVARQPLGPTANGDVSRIALDYCNPGYWANFSLRPPSQMPAEDTVQLTANPWDGSHTWQTHEFNQGLCNAVNYTQCKVEYTGPGQTSANYVYSITNMPVTVSITNNLADTYAISATPSVEGLVNDPAGGNATSIAPSATGYFGYYATAPQAFGNNPAKNSFSAVYQASQTAANLPGSSFTITAVLDPKTRQLTPDSSCTFVGANSQQAAQCSLNLSGFSEGPQALIVTFSPSSN